MNCPCISEGWNLQKERADAGVVLDPVLVVEPPDSRGPYPISAGGCAAAPRTPKAPPEVIDGLEVPTRAVHGEGTLMHHKYVIRDGRVVWTGSMNWTDDAFSLEENVILRIDHPELAEAYGKDFDQLWERARVERTGGDGPEISSAGVTMRPSFSPKASSLAHLAAGVLGTAKHRIRILSPVITSGVVLG